jgi:hypothetical protein
LPFERQPRNAIHDLHVARRAGRAQPERPDLTARYCERSSRRIVIARATRSRRRRIVDGGDERCAVLLAVRGEFALALAVDGGLWVMRTRCDQRSAREFGMRVRAGRDAT